MKTKYYLISMAFLCYLLSGFVNSLAAAEMMEKVVLAFDENGNGNKDLFMANPDGTDLVNLTPDSTWDEKDPRVSPNGTMIVALAVATNGEKRLLVYDLRYGIGSYIEFPADPFGDKRHPFWRTNDEILYEWNLGLWDRAIWAMAPDGTNSRSYIQWGNDGWPEPPVQVIRLSADGNYIGGDKADGYWYPTRDICYFTNATEPNSSTFQWCYEDPGNDNADYFIDYFPSGDVLCSHFVTSDPSADPIYFAVARTSCGSGTLTLLTPEDGFCQGMAVSPNGEKVLYRVFDDYPNLLTEEYWIMNSDGSNKQLWIPGTFNAFEDSINFNLADWAMVIPKQVEIDIKPGSCPNPLNLQSRGVLPVAILGTENFDVNTIDAGSIFLEGVPTIRTNYEDVATPVTDGNECECNTSGPDGYTDLTLKFRTPQLVEQIIGLFGELAAGDELILTLTGALSDGTPIEGEDCVVLVGNVPKALAAMRSDITGDGIVNVRDLAVLAEYWLESAFLEY